MFLVWLLQYWNSQYLSLSKLHFDWQGFSECARPESDLCWYLLPWPDTQGTTISCEETVKTDPLIHVIRVFEVKPSECIIAFLHITSYRMCSGRNVSVGDYKKTMKMTNTLYSRL